MQGLDLRFQDLGSGCRVWGSGFWVWNVEFRVSGFGFRAWGVGCRLSEGRRGYC